MIVKENADIVFFTGDLVNDRANELNGWGNELSRIKAPLGVYSVLGNHDYGKNNVDDCFRNACARRMVNYMTDRMQSFNPVAMDHKFKNYYNKKIKYLENSQILCLFGRSSN